MNVVIAGGTGFIGTILVRALSDARHRVTVLSRRPLELEGRLPLLATAAAWDGKSVGAWAAHLDKADAVLNFVGESIAGGRWTAARKEFILASRLEPTRALVEAIGRAPRRPSLFLCASAVGIYGDTGERMITEKSKIGGGFMADVCKQFEEAAGRAAQYGARVVKLRTGVVLAEGGGVLEKMVPQYKLFAGGPLGSGRQWFSWIHRDDLASIVLFVLSHQELTGPLNAVSPHPVTMDTLARALGRALHRPSWNRVPSALLRVLLGEMADTVLKGQRVIPKLLIDTGFTFKHPDIDEALRNVLK